jgi:hypothetical protein
MSVVAAKMSALGAYSDPNHPDCGRFIWPNEDGTAITEGMDNINGEGFSCKDIRPPTLVSWGPLPTLINGTAVIIDFSSKGGPSNLHGDWKQGTNKDGTNFSGIQWEDGNYWTQVQPDSKD